MCCLNVKNKKKRTADVPDLGDMLKINPKDKALGDLLVYPHCMNGEKKMRELSTYRQRLTNLE